METSPARCDFFPCDPPSTSLGLGLDVPCLYDEKRRAKKLRTAGLVRYDYRGTGLSQFAETDRITFTWICGKGEMHGTIDWELLS